VLGLQDINPLIRVLNFSADQKSFKDTEFSNPNHLYYSQITMKRLPLSELRKVDPSGLKPSRLSKQLKSLLFMM